MPKCLSHNCRTSSAVGSKRPSESRYAMKSLPVACALVTLFGILMTARVLPAREWAGRPMHGCTADALLHDCCACGRCDDIVRCGRKRMRRIMVCDSMGAFDDTASRQKAWPLDVGKAMGYDFDGTDRRIRFRVGRYFGGATDRAGHASRAGPVFRDSANAPYGTKTPQEVRRLSFDIMERFMSQGSRRWSSPATPPRPRR